MGGIFHKRYWKTIISRGVVVAVGLILPVACVLLLWFVRIKYDVFFQKLRYELDRSVMPASFALTVPVGKLGGQSPSAVITALALNHDFSQAVVEIAELDLIRSDLGKKNEWSPSVKTLSMWDIHPCLRITSLLETYLSRCYNYWPALAFSPDNALLAAGGQDNILRVYDMASGRIRLELTGHTALIHPTAFSPDGRFVASGAEDKTVRVWETKNGNSVATLNDCSDAPYQVGFSPDSSLIAALFWHTSIGVWKPSTGEKVFQRGQDQPNLLRYACVHFAFSPDGRTIAVADDYGFVMLFDIVTGNKTREFQTTCGALSLAFRNDGKILAMGMNDGTVQLWNTATWTCILMLADVGLVRSSTHILQLAFSPDGRKLLVVDKMRFRVWDVDPDRNPKLRL